MCPYHHFIKKISSNLKLSTQVHFVTLLIFIIRRNGPVLAPLHSRHRYGGEARNQSIDWVFAEFTLFKALPIGVDLLGS